MATSNGVWGIDIGQCALKAMRCTLDADNNMVADAFDFIEYPKILSQPEADRDQLIADALQKFLSRNDVKGDKVAISVAGQNGLARFFKPPPVDSKKIPDIVKYEAKQQIPFALEDVIWDYQRMGGGAEVDGVALEAEIGLFAMKRDQVFRLLEPFEAAGFELDVVQLAPLSIYNFISHCLITDGPAPEDYNPEDPPESVVVISVGTDTTDIVVTNGFRVWQRNIPLGGNHFTKQLTKELKLTFAKAEHLKRNARQAEGAKAIFQAMRPSFNDLLTEVQRSMNFFHNNDKAAKISGMVMLGNAVKLPGLQSYLAKNLGYDVIDLDESTWKKRISGPAVLSSPAFKDNILAFGVCYGLCLQGLSQSHLSTNLLPKEIITQRLVREKKPWAVAAVSAMMLAFAFNLFFVVNNWYMVHDDRSDGGKTWAEQMKLSTLVQKASDTNKAAHKQSQDRILFLDTLADEVAGNKDRQLLWPELHSAVTLALPISEGLKPGEVPDVKKVPFGKQSELHILYVETQYFDDLNKWMTPELWKDHLQDLKAIEDPNAVEPAENENGPPAVDANKKPVIQGGGWVVELHGYHFHNDPSAMNNSVGAHVRKTFMKNLMFGNVDLPKTGLNPPLVNFQMKELGIKYVTMIEESQLEKGHMEPNPYYRGPVATGPTVGTVGVGEFPSRPGDGGGNSPLNPSPRVEATTQNRSDDGEPEFLKAPRFVFTVQFCWQEVPLSVRLKKPEAAKATEQEKTVATTRGGN
ncbi:MAG: type IV pilus assembly protein PilM [Pirellulaceae bacterium]|jgi:type IV pilus assembly protein PilM